MDIGEVSGDYADVYVYNDDYYSPTVAGVAAYDDVGNFLNTGIISASVGIGDVSGYSADAYVYSYYEYSPAVVGAYLYYGADNFTNTGSIFASVDIGEVSGDYADVGVYSDDDYSPAVVGVSTYDDVYEFLNSGVIDASINIGDVSGYDADIYVTAEYEEAPTVAGVYFYYGPDEFTNTGVISASVNIGDLSGEDAYVEMYTDDGYTSVVAGVLSYGSGDFVNKGRILANVNIGDLSGIGTYVEMYTYEYESTVVSGVLFDDSVDTFKNSGSIFASVKIGDITGLNSGVELYADYDNAPTVAGVYFDYDVDTLVNSGAIIASVETGDITSEDSFVYVYGYDSETPSVVGIYFYDNISELRNSGFIGANVKIGNALAPGTEIYAMDVYGMFFDSGVGQLINSGTISATVKAGGNAIVGNIAAIKGYYGDINIQNTGNIITEVDVGNNSTISHVAGIWSQNISNATINNEGLIYLKVDPLLAVGSVSVNNTAAIYVQNSVATISNPGIIHLYTDIPGANIRTLWLDDSTVTLQGKFSITYGDPGITRRPIFVDANSTLNLNDAVLVARAGVNLKINYPYYNIENDGTVNGTFSKLEDGTSNPDIKPYWYGSDRGEDSAVIFRYDPKHSTTSLSLHASRVMVRNVMNVVVSNMVYDKMKWLITKDERKVKFADSGQIVTDAANITPLSKTYRNGAFVFPYYFDVEADDLGYDARGYGFALGLERRIANAVSAGIFGGISKVDVDFNDRDYGGKDDEQDIYTLGLYANYVCEPWYVGLVAMGYAVQHDYEGLTGPNYDIHERADYWSHGFEGELVAGYMFGGRDWIVMPEVGIGYSYWRVSDFTTDADYSNWDKEYESESDSFVRLLAGITGLKRWNFTDTKFDIFASFRLEEAVGDNDIAITQSIPGIGSGKEKVEEDIGDTSFVGRVGFSITLKDRLKFNFTFRSEFNEDYTVYSGRASIGISF